MIELYLWGCLVGFILSVIAVWVLFLMDNVITVNGLLGIFLGTITSWIGAGVSLIVLIIYFLDEGSRIIVYRKK